MIEHVPAWDMDMAWPLVVPMIERPLARQQALDLASVYQMLVTGRANLWLMDRRAACVTQIQEYPRGRVCQIVLAGGDGVHDWIDELHETVRRHARFYGCKKLRINGRIGWLRLLNNFELSPDREMSEDL